MVFVDLFLSGFIGSLLRMFAIDPLKISNQEVSDWVSNHSGFIYSSDEYFNDPDIQKLVKEISERDDVVTKSFRNSLCCLLKEQRLDSHMKLFLLAIRWGPTDALVNSMKKILFTIDYHRRKFENIFQSLFLNYSLNWETVKTIFETNNIIQTRDAIIEFGRKTDQKEFDYYYDIFQKCVSFDSLKVSERDQSEQTEKISQEISERDQSEQNEKGNAERLKNEIWKDSIRRISAHICAMITDGCVQANNKELVKKQIGQMFRDYYSKRLFDDDFAINFRIFRMLPKELGRLEDVYRDLTVLHSLLYKNHSAKIMKPNIVHMRLNIFNSQ